MTDDHVDRLDLVGHVGPGAEDGPGLDPSRACARPEGIEHAFEAVDTHDEPGPGRQTEAGGAATDTHVEHRPTLWQCLQGPQARQPGRLLGVLLRSPTEHLGLEG